MSDSHNDSAASARSGSGRPRRDHSRKGFFDRFRRSPRRKRRSRRSRGQRALWILGSAFFVLFSMAIQLACVAAWYVNTVIVPMVPVNLDNIHTDLNSVLYYTDAQGHVQELRTLHGDENRIWVEYADIPTDLINATVAIEDQRFWTHSGVDWKRTAAAVLYMFTGQDIQGGSTITQQLLKNVTTYDDTTVKRKVVEIFRALEFTKNNTKETTLEWYLNFIYMGRGCDGVYTASYMYFGKPLSELTVAECASLISITNNPSLYDPFTNPENNLRRKNLVLKAMYEQNYLTRDEYEAAKAQELEFKSASVQAKPTDNPDIYSWYEEQVITDVTNDLAKALGVEVDVAHNMVLSGGLHIYTCINPDIQAAVEEFYENPANFPWPSKSGQQLQSAITVIDNQTGDVVALVGRVGSKAGNRLRNNATTATRQPGSSLKPLSVYAPALDMGLITPISIIDDYPAELAGKDPYPVNSGKEKYAGLTTVYSGLTKSTNTVAFRILSNMVQPANSFNFVEQRFKIDLLSPDMDRAPLSMGGLTEGVNTRDMAEAFAVFPNQGVYTPSRTYTRVEDANGNVLLENKSVSEVVLKESTAYYMNTMLENVVINGTGKEARVEGMHVAGKTGSSTSDKDRWFAGYTPYYTAVVWTGYESPDRVRSDGKNPSAIAFSRVMTQIHKDLKLADKEFFTLNDLVTIEYCLDSGLVPTDACRNDVRGSRVAQMTLLREDAPGPENICTRHGGSAMLTVCLDDPILDANGAATGLYHVAGPYCPTDRLAQISTLDYTREGSDYPPDLLAAVSASDTMYTADYIRSQGNCTIHTTAPVIPEPDVPEGPIDPDDPNWSGNPDAPFDPDAPVEPDSPVEPDTPDSPPTDEPFVPATH